MHFLIILVLLFLSGCTNQGLNDAEAPKILGVTFDTNYSCTKGGTEVPCLLNSVPADTTTVKVRIIGSDDIGIAGYYILNEDSLVPPDWTTVAHAETTYDKTVTHYLPPGDGIKKIQVWIKDLGGKISDSTTAEVLVVSGQVKIWEKKTIDSKRDFANGLSVHSLRPDSSGNPQIVFGEHEIFNAVSDSSEWSIEKLEGFDTEDSPAGTVIDSAGNIHLSYIDNNKNLIYATNSSGSWVKTTMDSSGHVSGFPDIDYGIGGVHISYYDAAGRDLRYANCVSDCAVIENWNVKVVDSSDDVGIHSAIKAGNDGSVHISYFDNTNNSLKYVSADKDGLWGASVTIDTDSGGFSDIALSQDNRPYIAYYGSTGILKYATDESGKWDKFELDTDSITANFLSITIDDGNLLHISYHDTKSKSLKYASNASGLWKVTTIDSNGTAGLYNLISTSSGGRIHISYFDEYSKAVKYAVCTGVCTDMSKWKIERVLSSGDAGRYNSMVMDSEGKIHAAYMGGGELRYAENTTGTWRTAVVDGSGSSSSGEYSSIAIDSKGILHIAYYDNDNKGLKYAVCMNDCVRPENWATVIVDKGLNSVSFSYVSLTADTTDSLHISYYDTASGSLKYAFCNTGCTTDNNWKKVFVDVSVTVNNKVLTDVGKYSSIAIDKSSNKIYISYFDEISGSLKIAGCNSNCAEDSAADGIGDNWTIEPIDEGKIEPKSGSIDSRGKYTSVKVDNDGDVHISYFNETTGDMKYATNKSNDWVTTVIDKYDRAGIYTALSIGTDNTVYIAYYRYSVGLSVLKYAVCSSNCTSDDVNNITRSPETDGDGLADNWETYILGMFDNPGMFASITADGGIHVVYYNPDTGGLDYLKQ